MNQVHQLTTKLTTVRAELADVEHQSDEAASDRARLRLRAVADQDADAAAELDVVTKTAAALAIRREDLAAVVAELETQLVGATEAQRKADYRAELEILRTMNKERLELARRFDVAAVAVAGLATQYQSHCDRMRRHAEALGFTTMHRLTDPNALAGALLFRWEVWAPTLVRWFHKMFRRPLIDHGDSLFGRLVSFDREAPDEWVKRAPAAPPLTTEQEQAASAA